MSGMALKYHAIGMTYTAGMCQKVRSNRLNVASGRSGQAAHCLEIFALGSPAFREARKR